MKNWLQNKFDNKIALMSSMAIRQSLNKRVDLTLEEHLLQIHSKITQSFEETKASENYSIICKNLKFELDRLATELEKTTHKINAQISEKFFETLSRISSANLPEDCTLSGLNTLNILLIKGVAKLETNSVLGRDFVCFVLALLKVPSLTGQVLLLVGNSLMLNSAILDYTLIQILIEGMNNFVYSTKNLQLYRYSFWLLRVMFVIIPNDPSNADGVQNMVQTLNLQKIYRFLNSLFLEKEKIDCGQNFEIRKNCFLDFLWLACFVSDHFGSFNEHLSLEIIGTVFGRFDKNSLDFLLILIFLHFVNSCEINFVNFCGRFDAESIFNFMDFIVDSKNDDLMTELLILMQNYYAKMGNGYFSVFGELLQKIESQGSFLQNKTRLEMEIFKEMIGLNKQQRN